MPRDGRYISPRLRPNNNGYAPNAFSLGVEGEPTKPKTSLSSITLTLSVDTADQGAEVSGDMIWFQSATSRTQLIGIRLDDTRNDITWLAVGQYIRGVAFSRLYFTFTANGSATATILVFQNAS